MDKARELIAHWKEEFDGMEDGPSKLTQYFKLISDYARDQPKTGARLYGMSLKLNSDLTDLVIDRGVTRDLFPFLGDDVEELHLFEVLMFHGAQNILLNMYR